MKREDLLPLCEANNAVVLVIDLQGKLFRMIDGHEALCHTVGKLLRIADLFEVPVLVTEQYPQGLGPTAPELASIVEQLGTEKYVLQKDSFGCCGDAGFCARLEDVGNRVCQRRAGPAERPLDIIVTGIETHICVQQTVLELLGRGHRVVVLQDCTASRIPAHQQLALERFRQCGAILSNYESLTFEWARTRKDARFKQLSAIVKEAPQRAGCLESV